MWSVLAEGTFLYSYPVAMHEILTVYAQEFHYKIASRQEANASFVDTFKMI